MSRDVTGQIVGFTARLRRFCGEGRISAGTAGRILRFLKEHAQRGGAGLDRTTLMAQLAALRADAPPRDLSLLALAGQATYFAMGASGHVSSRAGEIVTACALFPGRFACSVRRHADLLPADGVPP